MSCVPAIEFGFRTGAGDYRGTVITPTTWLRMYFCEPSAIATHFGEMPHSRRGLCAITRNHCLTALKKSCGDPAASVGRLDRDLRETNAVDPLKQIEQHQKCLPMWELIAARLSPTEAHVMRLHYGCELPLASITTKLMLSNPSGAKAYIVNAKRKLNAVLMKRRNRARLAAA